MEEVFAPIDHEAHKWLLPNEDWITASALARNEPVPRRWAAQYLLPGDTATLLTGDGGTGKSLIALQLAVAMTSGGKWLGVPVTPGPVLYLSAEDDARELHRRLLDICHSDGIDPLGLIDLHLLPLSDDALLMVSDSSNGVLKETPLLLALEDKIKKVRPVQIVLDALADIFGGNEIIRTQVRQFIGRLRQIANANNCSVLVLGHPSLSGISSGSGISGSTAWNNSFRHRLYFERDGDDGECKLTVRKANYAAVGFELKVRWQNGVFVPLGECKPGRLSKMVAENAADQKFLEMLDRFEAQGRNVCTKNGSNFAPSQFAEQPDAGGIKKKGFQNAMNRLLNSGKITQETVGPESRQRNKLVRTADALPK